METTTTASAARRSPPLRRRTWIGVRSARPTKRPFGIRPPTTVVLRRAIRRACPSVRSRADEVEALDARRDFALLWLPVPVQVAVGDMRDADELDLSDRLVLGIIDRVNLGTARGEHCRPGCEARVEVEVSVP